MPTQAVLQGLKLNERQEAALMDQVQKRHTDIRVEMGWLSEHIYDGWLEDRRQAQAEYGGDFSHRRGNPKYGPLFNFEISSSLNIPRRAAMVWVARARESMLNSENFAEIAPEGEEDESKAEPVPGLPVPPDPIKLFNRYWNRKLTEAKANIQFRNGLEQAAVGGEVVYKITKKLAEPDDDEEEKQIWLDGAGEPLRDTRGRFVFADESFEPHPDAIEGEILKRDPSVVKMPDAAISEEKYPAEPSKPKMALNIEVIDYRSFICSPTAEDIHTADYIAHVFDMDLDELWRLMEGVKLTPEARAWMDSLKSQSVQAKTDSGMPNLAAGEKERGPSAPVKLHLAESWLRFDARERGAAEELCVLWDVTTGHPIHYELAKKVSPTGRRPFEVDRLVSVPGRWYGAGFYKRLANEHFFIDLQVARINMRTGTSGRFTYMREGTLKDVEGGWDINLNSPDVFTATSLLQPGQHPIEHVELPPMDEKIWDLKADREQAATLMTGTATGGDAAAANLNQSKTLGAQEMLASESELMSNDTMQDARHGIELALKQSLVAVLTDFDEEESNELLGVTNGQILTEWVKTTAPKSLLHRVKLSMTAQRNRKRAEANAQALQVTTGAKSWLDLQAMVAAGQIQPKILDNVKPLYRAVLESSEIEGIEGILSIPVPPPMPGLPPAAPGQPPGAIPPQEPPLPPLPPPSAPI